MASLQNCIMSLRESVALVEDSIKALDATTHDIPRVQKVLMTRRVFGLVPETDLENAKQTFKESVEPQISTMLERIDRELQKMSRRKINLQNRHDLQAVRLQGSKREAVDLPFSRLRKLGPLDEAKLTRLKFLKNKKERLKYSLSRLRLQDRLSVTPSLPPP
ncbi:DASH complex, subunit Spc19 [Suhomyces tanzawaensis NRRL Y-17324]|uniref:DASH complex subunit SPC19 n=1 Tax=Suhomyces tanzawaensis NRRL Y-17324 TaxID=984487 RepID=A0A1E4SLJ4_9ASCO|nr:DASH complex, subunit Spc19 [Suhomyces tanzawaensis NRRL Y-17324]ODV80368.1 DASH complex, subunit Spc19 [Suhomyces tanzawaensis NRRL Y-17324]